MFFWLAPYVCTLVPPGQWQALLKVGVYFVIALGGGLIGNRLGAHFGKRMESVGGVILIGIGLRVQGAACAGVDLRKQGIFGTTTVGSQMTFGGAFGLLLADRMVQVGPEIYGTTVMTGSDSFSKATTNLEGILGARFRLGQRQQHVRRRRPRVARCQGHRGQRRGARRQRP